MGPTLCEAAEQYCRAKSRLSTQTCEEAAEFLAARDALRGLLESLWPGQETPSEAGTALTDGETDSER